ncbi:MAG: SMP-30/gluconolactonase/LRE family protein [Pirellulales bacterium]|nr:SMP-30/gluconolactonase/LRE family protein [Pirellulales bacterium]
MAKLFYALMLVCGLACGGLATAGDFRATAQEKIVPQGAQLELLWGEGEFTEGPAAAADGAILFSDIGNRILRYDPRSHKTTVFREPSGRANGLFFDTQGRLVACEGANTGGTRRISITDTKGNVRTLAERYDGKRFNSPNDLAVDEHDRVYFTDPRYVGDEPRELDFQAVFLIEPDGAVRIATRDVEQPNGILVSPDGKHVYVADNSGRPEGNHHLLSFVVQQDGTLAEKKVLFDFGPNRRGIDGMTLDAEGNLYATAGDGAEAGIYVFDPQGTPLAFIATPGGPTNCVFGVGTETRVLYVTAPVAKQSDDDTAKYGLYRITLEKPGYHLFPTSAK